ncbi:MAG: cyclic nucleotide-binding domain-containing protein [Pirellulales bacterium]
MNKNELIKTLQENRFLHDIDPAHLAQIANIAQLCDFAPHDVVFREGQNADSVYLVVSGKLSLELSPSTIYRKHLVSVGPGEMLGWSSLVENPRFAATAVVVDPARLVRIDGQRLRAICDDDPRFGYEFMRRTMRALANRLTATWTQLSHLYVSHYLPVTASMDE